MQRNDDYASFTENSTSGRNFSQRVDRARQLGFQMSPEEKATLKELNRKTFWSSSLPTAVVLNAGYVYYAKRNGVNPGIIRPALLGLFGFYLGSAMKMNSTISEVMRRHPDGAIATEMKNREKRQGYIGPTEEGRYQRHLPEQYQSETPSFTAPIKRHDQEASRNYDSMGLDDSERPSMDRGGLDYIPGSSADYSGPDDSHSSPVIRDDQVRKGATYDEIRRKHRGLPPTSSPQNELPFFDRNPSSQSNYGRQPPSQPDFQREPRPSGRRNKYGDLIEDV